ncbi:MAG TPA: zf-HC2 domain-containing protein [Candidatus Coprocola pullicola]|nr:zf-HC2 domain-containing protein [Candidatus Coprocola pullicola]
MKCQDAEKYIMKYMDGEISKQEAEQLNQHMQHCTACKRDFEFYDTMLDLFEQMPVYEAPADFEIQVMMQIQALEEGKQRRHIKNRIWGHIWGTFTVLFGTGAILVLYRDQIIASLAENPYFAQWLLKLAPIEETIAQQGKTLQMITENVAVLTDKILLNSAGILLVLLSIVCGIQYMLLKRKKETDKVRHR